tara:strand:- start:1622 stop:1984 length:363 start_codon:yes stop_codon:yes gene_type:complete
MSERIRINYTIKFEKMQDEIKRLFNSVIDDIDCASNTYTVPSDVLSTGALEVIKELRSFAYDTEQSLADIETLIKSYLHYTTQPSSEQVTPDDSIDKLSNLKTMLESLQLPDGVPNEVAD